MTVRQSCIVERFADRSLWDAANTDFVIFPATPGSSPEVGAGRVTCKL